jgi:hypothetical protein
MQFHALGPAPWAPSEAFGSCLTGSEGNEARLQAAGLKLAMHLHSRSCFSARLFMH